MRSENYDLGTKAREKLEEFEQKFKSDVEHQMKVRNIVASPRIREAVYKEALEDVEYGMGAEIVASWIEKKWGDDYDWDEDSDENDAEYFLAHIFALKDGMFHELIERAITEVTKIEAK